MLAPITNVIDFIEIVINSVDDAKKQFRDLTRPTEVELNNIWNKLRENTANIPNPMCIGGQFELSICITNGSEWFSVEMGRVNQERFEIAETAHASDNARAAAAVKPTAPETSIVIYTCATKIDCDLYQKLSNPGRFVVDVSKLADNITIAKIQNDTKLKEYAAVTFVDSAVQHFLWKIFGLDIFADIQTNDNWVLNKCTALQMRQHLDFKFNKLHSIHIKGEMI